MLLYRLAALASSLYGLVEMFLSPFEIKLQNPFRSNDEESLPGDISSPERESILQILS